MKLRIIGAVALLALGGCGTMTVDRRTMISSDIVDAWTEIRTVRGQLDLMDSVNDSYELWGVNRSDETVCVGYRPSGSYWSTWELAPRSNVKLITIGSAYSGYPPGEHGIIGMRTAGCSPSRFGS